MLETRLNGTRYSVEFYLNDKDLETDFSRDAKSCQPTCDQQFPTFREKDYTNHLIEQYLQYQPVELVQYVKEFDFQFSDITDEEMTFFIDMLLDSRDVYSQHKFNVGKTRQKFHVMLKQNVELKRQRSSEVPLHFVGKTGETFNSVKECRHYSRNGRRWRNGIIIC